MNTNTQVIPLALERARGRAQKIALNVLGENPENTIFTIPYIEIPLVEQQLDAILGKYTHRSWYEQRTDGAWHPMPYWHRRKDESYSIDDTYHVDRLTLGVEADRELEFETKKAESEDDDDIPGAKISAIRFKPTPGGITLLSFHLQVRPGLGETNLTLQRRQFGDHYITFANARPAPKNAKQQQLALEPPKTDKPAEAAQESGEQPTPESDAALDQAIGRPPAVESQGGDAIDAELHARHPEVSGEVMGADATNTDLSAENGMDPDLEADLQRFEDNARQAIANSTSLSERGAIDGRSERVKHQDAQRETEGEVA